MIELDELKQAFELAFCLLPVAVYFGICISIAIDIDDIVEWFSCFLPVGLETVGDVLLWLLLAVLHLTLTPGAIVFYFVRGILRINISHIRKDNDNEDCNSRF